jgi:hypothetical protein
MTAIDGMKRTRVSSKKLMLRLVIGGVLGGAMGAGFVWALTRLHIPIHQVRWPDLLALWLGVTLLGVGLLVFAISFNRRELAQNIEGEEAKLPATDDEVHVYRLQAAALALAGVMILLPLAAMSAMAQTRGIELGVMAAIVALFALQTTVNVMVWRRSDEFQRGQLMAMCAVAFAIDQGALFLWAAAEHLHLAPAISSWAIFQMLMLTYLTVGAWLALKNRPGNYGSFLW